MSRSPCSRSCSPPLFDHVLGQIGGIAATLCVVAGLGGFVAVVRNASALDEQHTQHVQQAKTLFWITVGACAVLINVFATAFNIGGDSELGLALVVWVTLAVVATGAAVLAILSIAIAIGFEDPGSAILRWGLFIAAVFLPVCIVDSELWWVGLIGGFLLASAVEMAIHEALERWHVPAPALGACLVAGVTAVVLLVIYVVVRFVLRFAGSVLAGAGR